MSKTKKRHYCKLGLPLRTVLRKWITLNERIARDWQYKDVPWWYNERAALSIFSGGIWNSGEFAFEEFSDEKRTVSARSRRFHRTYKGRVDLYFNIAGKEFIAEAKVCWPRCSRINGDNLKIIRKYLGEACADVRISKPRGQRRLGILFVVPRWKRELRHEIDRRIDSWVAKVSELDCDAAAWLFPAGTRKLRLRSTLYPGTAVLIKEVRR